LNPLHALSCYFFKTTRHIHCLSEVIVQEAGWTIGPMWTGVEKKLLHLALTGIRTPNHPACSATGWGPPLT